MADITFATSIFVDDGVLTATNEVSALPGTNLQDIQPTKKWRTTSLSTMAIEIDLTTAKAVNLISLIAHNATSTATWRIRGATSQAILTSTTVGYDSSTITMWPSTGKPQDWNDQLFSLKWLGSNAQTFRWWRVDVFDDANGDGYFEAGRLIIDNAWQPTVGLSPNWGFRWIDPGTRERSIIGNLYPTQRTRHRIFEFTLDFNDKDAMLNNAAELQRKRGISQDVFILADPTGTTHLHKESVYGLFTDLQPLVNTAFDIFSQVIIIEEMI